MKIGGGMQEVHSVSFPRSAWEPSSATRYVAILSGLIPSFAQRVYRFVEGKFTPHTPLYEVVDLWSPLERGRLLTQEILPADKKPCRYVLVTMLCVVTDHCVPLSLTCTVCAEEIHVLTEEGIAS